MNNLVLPLLIPLITAVLSILARKSSLRDYISLIGSLFYLTAVTFLGLKVFSIGPLSIQAGGWPAPFGITLVADQLSILMLVLTSIVSLTTTLYSWGYISSK